MYTLSLWHYVCYTELMSLAVAMLSNAHPNNTSLKIESMSAPPNIATNLRYPPGNESISHQTGK